MHVLIAGAGYVGMELARQLAARSVEVTALRRSQADPVAGVRMLNADVNGPALALPRSITHLVYAVSPSSSRPDSVHVPGRTVRLDSERSGDEQYSAAYQEGLENVLRALSRAGSRLERAMLTTSTAVYAQDDGSVVDEDSPVSSEPRAQRLLAAERILARACEVGINLRLGGIYGPGRDRMIRMVEEGRARLPPGPRYTNRIHRDDAAGAIAHLLTVEPAAGVYVVVDDDPADLRELYKWIAAQLGRPEPEVETGDEAPRGKRARNARLRATGWSLRFPSFRQGYAALMNRPPRAFDPP